MTKVNTEREFWSRVDKSQDCWLWQGQRCSKGYGRWQMRGQAQGSHRWSWEFTYGAIPRGLFVCHRCDNPSCVRPQHLFLGSAQDNNQDKIEKQRHCRGSGHPSHKLTEQAVSEILQELKTYVPRSRPSLLGQLADRYSVNVSKIKQIRLGQSWRHVERSNGLG